MRKIDADTLREKIEAYCKDAEKVLGMVGGCITNSIEYIISQIPTIESEPVKHGKWIYREFDVPHCSECGAEPKEISPFCPKCGAKMDLEV